MTMKRTSTRTLLLWLTTTATTSSSRVAQATSSSISVFSTTSEGTISSGSIWADIQTMSQTLETARQRHGQVQQEQDDNHDHDNRALQLNQFRLLCDLAIEIFDDAAPQNDNRECECLWATQALHCKYNAVTCLEKVLPSVEVTFDLGLLKSTVEICQEFAEEEFEPVCIHADLNKTKYGTCSKATMGKTECACEVCEGGLTLDVDCTENHPLAKTNGCQRVFFQDSCLDFMPLDADAGVGAETEVETDPNEAHVIANENPADVLNATAEAVGFFGNPFAARTIDGAEFTPSPTPEGSMESSSEGTSESTTVDNSTFTGFAGHTINAVPPQQRATEWVQADPNFSSYSTSKKMQRYALATLYYSTTTFGVGWFESTDWLSYDMDECDWFYSNTTDRPCYDKNNNETGELLETLDLSENGLFGPLVPEIGYLRTLTELYLSNNFLSGTIPTEIGSLTNLEEVDLSSSDVGGIIPTELGLLSNLESLSLQFNWLNGPIPSELGLLTNLGSMELYGNFLTGSVPVEICDLIWAFGTDVSVECDVTSCTCGCTCF